MEEKLLPSTCGLQARNNALHSIKNIKKSFILYLLVNLKKIMFLITTSALPCCCLAMWTENNFAQINIPQVRRVRKQDHQHTDSHINQMAPLNAPSDPAQSPHHSEPTAWFCRCIHVEDPCTRQLKLLTLTWIHTPSKFFKKGKKKKRVEVACRIEAKQAIWHVYWQFCSPDTDGRARLCSPLPHLRHTGKENVHCD